MGFSQPLPDRSDAPENFSRFPNGKIDHPAYPRDQFHPIPGKSRARATRGRDGP